MADVGTFTIIRKVFSTTTCSSSSSSSNSSKSSEFGTLDDKPPPCYFNNLIYTFTTCMFQYLILLFSWSSLILHYDITLIYLFSNNNAIKVLLTFNNKHTNTNTNNYL